MQIDGTEIVIVEDIISIEDAELLVQLGEAASEDDWNTATNSVKDPYAAWTSRNLLLNLIDFSQDKIDNIVDKCKDAFFTSYGLDRSKYGFTLMAVLHRMLPGRGMGSHTDTGDFDVNRNVTHGFVLYLNDEYSGGEIFYENIGLEIKPKKLSLVMHPGDEYHRHGVRDVVGCTRYTLTFFATRNS